MIGLTSWSTPSDERFLVSTWRHPRKREYAILATLKSANWARYSIQGHQLSCRLTMPLINGYKYSCEPCIRGHRATSCAHTDRILIEVRKPGRPLESCGHQLDTCSCGRLNDIFSIGDAPLDQPFVAQQPTFVAATPAPTVKKDSKSKAKPRSRMQSKSTKKPSRRKSTASSTPQSDDASGQMDQSPLPQSPSETSTNPYEQYPYGAPSTANPQPSMWTPAPIQSSAAPLPNPYMPYQPHQRFDGAAQTPYTYAPAPQPGSYGAQSRVEDIAMPSNPRTQQSDSDGGQAYMRSQYISANQDQSWRPTR
ncbi:hypothetical protein G7Y89_g4438 [Cudoniella acicularis]|uniref:Copper-fist domain-containing protein n=1 Tax=Cudoniella acicularis TaxID=354080 RepID=A0A8H4W6P5_9HELO|nr:hypothetical protein G7Y89_g4438 [Cudoniella acicularis]